MINCRDVDALLCDLVCGELPADRQAHVDHHLSICPACLAYVESYRLTIRLARQLPPAEPPQSMYDRLHMLWKQDASGPAPSA